jgi:hypothetical protein
MAVKAGAFFIFRFSLFIFHILAPRLDGQLMSGLGDALLLTPVFIHV